MNEMQGFAFDVVGQVESRSLKGLTDRQDRRMALPLIDQVTLADVNLGFPAHSTFVTPHEPFLTMLITGCYHPFAFRGQVLHLPTPTTLTVSLSSDPVKMG